MSISTDTSKTGVGALLTSDQVTALVSNGATSAKWNDPYSSGIRYGRSLDLKEYLYDVYLDPTATGSAETGTYANPFLSLQTLNTWLNANAASYRIYKTVGIKRGTTTRTTAAWALGVAGSTLGGQLRFAPYGDALDLPTLCGNVVVSNWVQIASSPAIWRSSTKPHDGTGWTVETGIYQNGNRLWVRNGTSTSVGTGDTTTDPNTRTYAQKLADITAQGPGTCFYDNGTGTGGVANSLVIYPFDNENPNLGQVECPVVNYLIQTSFPNQNFVGNILFEGICFRGARDVVNAIVMPVGGAYGYKNISHHRCVVMQGGVDTGTSARNSSGALANNLILMSGAYGSARNVGGSVTECYLGISGSNCVEINSQDKLLVEKNVMNDFSGNGLEIYSSGSSNVFRYNEMYGDRLGANQRAYSTHGGVWFNNLRADIGGGTTVDETACLSNEAYMNYGENLVYGASIGGGGSGGIANVHHNTWNCTAVLGGRLAGGGITTTGLRYTSQYAGASCNYSNNLQIFSGNYNGGGVVYADSFQGAAAGSSPTGDYNVYSGQNMEFINRAGTTLGADLTAWKAYATGYGANSVGCSSFTGGSAWVTSDALVGKRGQPLSNSFALVGTSALTLGYTRDIEGNPIPAASMYAGCHAFGK